MTDLVIQERTLPTLVPAQQWAERRRQFNEWVNTQLREGIDYGKVPGTDKDTLLKPGAEKIAQAYGCAPMLDITVRDQNVETGYLYIEVAVRLVSITTGAVVAVGVGSASSYESKYRYRYEWWNARADPPGDGGWERTRNGKWRRRALNPDLIDVWNTVLKMAKKRGLVDAALTVSGASEKFTQDVEDMPDVAPVEPEQRPVPAPPIPPEPAHVEPKPVAEPPRTEPQSTKLHGWANWSEKAHAAFWAKAHDLGLGKEVTHAGFCVQSMSEYESGTMDDAMTILQALDYAVNKTSIGVAGINDALSCGIADAVANGADFAAIKNAVDIYIDAKVRGGADIKRQEALAI